MFFKTISTPAAVLNAPGVLKTKTASESPSASKLIVPESDNAPEKEYTPGVKTAPVGVAIGREVSVTGRSFISL